MSTKEYSVTEAFCKSISPQTKGLAVQYAELGIDAFLDEGILRDIPILSTVIGVYKLGNGIRELHYLRKLSAFVESLNRDVANENERQDYISKIMSGGEKSAKEIEYILILISRYVHEGQSEMLARCYLSYLQGATTWNDFAKCAEIIDRFLPGDKEFLLKNSCCTAKGVVMDDTLIRLSALGLYCIPESPSALMKSGNGHINMTSASMETFIDGPRTYELTELGKTISNILQ